MPFSSSERIGSLWLLDVLRRDCCSTSFTGAVYPSLWNCKVIGGISEGRCRINFANAERATHSGRGECGGEPRRGANAVFGSFGMSVTPEILKNIPEYLLCASGHDAECLQSFRKTLSFSRHSDRKILKIGKI